ncbi:MAG: DNA polymerase III subunit beta [Pseudomonadales bacterium]|nr:DNA polymerase III subunit beta [Pseudomonadales bacterium]
MKFSVNREALLRPLIIVAGAVERRQTMPILSNLLIIVSGNKLVITGTDLEVELSATIILDDAADKNGDITVPARKLVDICKSLPDSCDISFSLDQGKAVVKSGRSRYTLATLPAADFPSVQKDESSFSATVNQGDFAQLIDRTAFSMAQQDVRYYLNGMLWELSGNKLKAVATDGHRLAIAHIDLVDEIQGDKQQFIVPRKGVVELTRLLSDESAPITIEFGANHIRATTNGMVFVSKLVDGKFPDYERVLPKGGNKIVSAERSELKSALSRSAILSNEKFRGIRFTLSDGMVGIQANNPEQEEAHEEVSVSYQGDSVEMGFNVSYLIDVLGALRSDQVTMTLSDSNSSALVQDGDTDNNALYVVMPMRL